jgi:hypothetical protein
MKPEFRFDTAHIEWTHLEGGPEFDYLIDYEIAVLGSQVDNGTLDLLVKFAPNSYCHFHRHCAATTTLVLEGEQHIYETSADGETIHKVRSAGTYAHSAGGDVHMEQGGPEGALVFFAMHAPDGKVFELLDADRKVLSESNVEEMAKGLTAI